MKLASVLSPADATVVVALIVVISSSMVSWYESRNARKQSEANMAQLHPNGGKSVRDAIDRIEATLATEVVPRLDRAAHVLAAHADRLAVIEARNKSTRSRKDD